MDISKSQAVLEEEDWVLSPSPGNLGEAECLSNG